MHCSAYEVSCYIVTELTRRPSVTTCSSASTDQQRMFYCKGPASTASSFVMHSTDQNGAPRSWPKPPPLTSIVRRKAPVSWIRIGNGRSGQQSGSLASSLTVLKYLPHDRTPAHLLAMPEKKSRIWDSCDVTWELPAAGWCSAGNPWPWLRVQTTRMQAGSADANVLWAAYPFPSPDGIFYNDTT